MFFIPIITQKVNLLLCMSQKENVLKPQMKNSLKLSYALLRCTACTKKSFSLLKFASFTVTFPIFFML